MSEQIYYNKGRVKMSKYVNDRNNYEKIEPFDWSLDIEMNPDFIQTDKII